KRGEGTMGQQPSMRKAGALLGLTAMAALVALACHRTPQGVRIDTRHAAAQARRLGDDATAALSKAGREVARETKAIDRQAAPLLADVALTAKVRAKLAADPRVPSRDVHVDSSK